MESIIERNKKIMKEFEEMICCQDTKRQEELSEILVDPEAPFFTPASPEPLYGGKGYLAFVYMLRSSFSDIHWKMMDMAVDNEKAAILWEATGTHDGPFMGKEPTGKKLKFSLMNFYYINEKGKIYKDVAADGMYGILKPLGLAP